MLHLNVSGIKHKGQNQKSGAEDKPENQKYSDAQSRQQSDKQRRAFFRVNYPAKNQLKVLNMDVEVVDICQKSLRFCGFNQWDKLSKVIENDEILELFVLFHDNTVEKVKGRLTKSYSDIHSRKQYYILMSTKDIKSKKISVEQSYLLKYFPDFSRYIFDKSCQAG